MCIPHNSYKCLFQSGSYKETDITLTRTIVSILIRFQLFSYKETDITQVQESYSVYPYKIPVLLLRGILQDSYKNPTVSILIRFQLGSYEESYMALGS